jgi:hypothetical protein
MKSPSILLALFVVLGLAREAGASLIAAGEHDFTFTVSGYSFGFVDWQDGSSIAPLGGGRTWTYLHLGPLGYFEVPVTAIQGLIGSCFVLAMLIILPIAFTMQRRNRRLTRANR